MPGLFGKSASSLMRVLRARNHTSSVIGSGMLTADIQVFTRLAI
jgi:hypothetical protein